MPFGNNFSTGLALGLFAIGLAFVVLAVGACSEPYPVAEPKPFIGEWAGNYSSGEVILLITMAVKANGKYEAVIRHDGDTLTRERGTWDADELTFHTRPEVCEDGPPLHLVSCSDGDSMPAYIRDGEWTVHFIDGDIVQDVILRRIK